MEGRVDIVRDGWRKNKTRIGGTRAHGRSIFSLPFSLSLSLSHTLVFFPTPLTAMPHLHLTLHLLSLCRHNPFRVHTCVIRTRLPRKESISAGSSYQLSHDCSHLSDLWTYAIVSGITSDDSFNVSYVALFTSFQFRPLFPWSCLVRVVHRMGKRGICYAWEKRRNENSRFAEGGGEISISR